MDFERLWHKHVLCRLGFHYETPGANFCWWGCGKVFNPDAFQTWIATLRDGESIEVSAVNEQHATTLVMYGGEPVIDWRQAKNGRIVSEPRIHSENIISIRRKTAIERSNSRSA